MWSKARINCATEINWNSCIIVGFIVRSHHPWQYDSNMAVYTHSYTAKVLYLTSDWVTVLWFWLGDCVCVCVRGSQQDPPQKPQQAETEPEPSLIFVEPCSHGPTISLYSVYESSSVFISVCICICLCVSLCVTLMCGPHFVYFFLSSLSARVELRL